MQERRRPRIQPPLPVEPKWDGFGVRLGRAIDRWPGGGQKKFATALKKYAEEHGLTLHTSYRTVLNYVSDKTRPSTAWVEAAAEVLRWRAENLLTGELPERDGAETRTSFQFTADSTVAPRTSALMAAFVNRYADLPMPARLMVFWFLDEYFEDVEDVEDGWEFTAPTYRQRAARVHGVLEEFFGPLLSASKMPRSQVNALAASLVAAAYIRHSSEGGR